MKSSESNSKPKTTNEPKPDPAPRPGDPADLNKVIDDSRKKLHSEKEKELSRKRGPGRPREGGKGGPGDQKTGGEPGQGAVLPEPTSILNDDREIKDLAATLQDGCENLAEITEWPGFKAKEAEAERVARRVHPCLKWVENRWFPKVDGGWMMWAFGLGSIAMFAGKRYLGFKKHLMSQFQPEVTASPTPEPVPDAKPLDTARPAAPLETVKPELAQVPGPNGAVPATTLESNSFATRI